MSTKIASDSAHQLWFPIGPGGQVYCSTGTNASKLEEIRALPSLFWSNWKISLYPTELFRADRALIVSLVLFKFRGDPVREMPL